MKRPFLPVAVLCLVVPLAFATTHGSSHSSSHGTHSHTSSSPRSGHHKKTKIPHQKRHVTYEEKKALFDQAGIPKSEWHKYVVDHKIPLELGGSNDLSNLQIQDKATGHRKDKVENYLARKVRDGEMSLSDAQAAIQHWETVDTTQ